MELRSTTTVNVEFTGDELKTLLDAKNILLNGLKDLFELGDDGAEYISMVMSELAEMIDKAARGDWRYIL